MAPQSCSHPDVRFYDDLGCCLSCGEIVDAAQESIGDSEETLCIAISTPLPDSYYVYKNLPSASRQEIRMIELLPGDWTEPIRCSITIEDFSTALEPYEALSYTWATESGDVSVTSRVYCENNVILVTQNCEAVLRRLRRSEGSRRLWVDAICINQSQVHERNHQVGLMDQIYLKASNVCICIEDPEYDYADCVRWLRTGKRPTRAAFSQTAELFRKRYFKRVWVIQEVVLANYLTLQLNGESVLLSGCITETFLEKCQKHGINVPTLLQNPASSTGNSIARCLIMSLNASCADPRDKIYGIISLLKPKTRAFIEVDYLRDYIQILQDVVLACIADSGSLGILLCSKADSEIDKSTVVFGVEELDNFLRNSKPIYNYLQWDKTIQRYTPGARPPHIPGYDQSAAKASHTYFPWRPTVTVATTSMEAIYWKQTVSSDTDTTSFISRSCYLDPSHPGYHLLLQKQILPCLLLDGHLLDISRGLMAIQTRDVINACKDHHKNGYESIQWLAQYFTLPRSSCFRSSPAMFPSESYHVCLEHGQTVNSRNIDMFIADIEFSGLGDKFFMFQTHYSVGFTAIKHKPGDCVFAIDSVTEPLLLRPLGNELYRVLGRCYLWAALNLDYWNVGSHLGLWPDRSYDLGTEQTRMIELY